MNTIMSRRHEADEAASITPSEKDHWEILRLEVVGGWDVAAAEDHVVVGVYSVFAFELMYVEQMMRNINKADDAKLNVESKSDAITYMRQLQCHHSMIKGRCDDVERCVHCGVSKATLLSWDAAFHRP